LFNNCIHSQNISSASKPPRQKTNLYKQLAPFPNALGKGWGWGYPLFLCGDTFALALKLTAER
jgi:hypothetical protein